MTVRMFSLLLPLCALAQQAINVRVVDPAGDPVPAAGISLRTGQAGEGEKGLTDELGKFTFKALADGEYTLAVQAEGLNAQPQRVKVAGAAVSVEVAMELLATKEEVTVSGRGGRVLEESIDPDRNADRLNFEDSLLDALPAQGQNALSVVSSFLSPAAQGAEGVTLVVDGVETSASALPASAIRRLRVNRNPYALQYRRPGKARIDVYTEEGSVRRYRGAFGLTARNSVFDAKNALAAEKPPMDRLLTDFNFSAPVSRGRSSFYVNGEHYRDNQMAVVNARTLAGPFIANVATPERRTRFLGRFETKGEVHQVSLEYNLLDQSEKNRGAGGLRLPEQGYPASVVSHRVRFSDRALLFNRVLNDFRISAQRETAERGGPAGQPALQVHGAFTAGPAQTNWSRTETAVRLQNLATAAVGRHNIRAGVEGRPASFDSTEASQFGGTFEFSGLEAFSSGQALLYRVNRGNPAVRIQQHEAHGFVQDETAVARGLNLTYGVRYSWQSDVADHNNLAPRVGFAYAPGQGKTVIRGGAGIFYERISEDVSRRALLWDGIRLRELVYRNATYPLPLNSFNVTPPASIVRATGLRAPVLAQASIALERQLWQRSTLAVEYSRLRGTHLLRSRNVNAPAGGLRPELGFLNINQVESSAAMGSHALAMTWRGNIGKRLTGMTQYTWSVTFDDTSGPFALAANSYNLRPEWGRSDYDQRHRFNAAASLDLRGGFRLGTFVTVATGSPFNITTGRDDNGDLIVNDRPVGTARNTGNGPGLAQVDLRLMKAFHAPRFLERGRNSTARNVEVSIDAFNVFNRVNFDGYNGVLTSPFFGRANAALLPRVIQLSIRYRL